DVVECVPGGFQKSWRQAARDTHAESVSISRGVFGGDPASNSGDRNLNCSTVAFQLRKPHHCRLAIYRVGCNLGFGQISQVSQQIMQRIDSLDSLVRIQPQQVILCGLDNLGIKQVAKLSFSKQLSQLGLIDRQSLRSALRERSVTVVYEIADVAEHQRRS